MAYVIMTAFMVVNGYVFWMIIEVLNNPRYPAGTAAMKLFFGGTIFFWLFKLFIVPTITMKSIAEERKNGTIETLMTAPVSDFQVVAGKYLASYLLYLSLWSMTLIYVFILRYYTPVDFGPVISGYLGTALIGAFFCAIGIFTSTLTKNQVIAAIISFAIMVGIFSGGMIQYLSTDSVVKDFFGYLNLWEHMNEFARGIVDSRRIVYYLSMTLLFLFLSVRTLESSRWR
jgi:ABC-2 type transport system permease protein